MRILSPMPTMSPHLSVEIFQVPPDALQLVQEFLRTQCNLLPYWNELHLACMERSWHWGAMHSHPCILDDSIPAGVDLQAGLCVLSTNTTSFMVGSLQGVIPIFVNEVDLGFTRIRYRARCIYHKATGA